MGQYDAYIDAYGALQVHEGGLSDHPADRGGMTYKGISRKFWSDWAGWPLIDDHLVYYSTKSPQEINRLLESDERLQRHVSNFYWAEFWLPVDTTLYFCPAKIKKFAFDCAVNHGERPAYRFLQRAYVTLSGKDIVVDGLVGPVTRGALREILRQNRGEDRLLSWAIYERMFFYDQLIDRDESQRAFAAGWGLRAMSFAKLIGGLAADS